MLWAWFLPLAYVDCTDLYRLPERRPRVMVALAGPFVDLVAAGLAAAVALTTTGEASGTAFMVLVEVPVHRPIKSAIGSGGSGATAGVRRTSAVEHSDAAAVASSSTSTAIRMADLRIKFGSILLVLSASFSSSVTAGNAKISGRAA